MESFVTVTGIISASLSLRSRHGPVFRARLRDALSDLINDVLSKISRRVELSNMYGSALEVVSTCILANTVGVTLRIPDVEIRFVPISLRDTTGYDLVNDDVMATDAYQTFPSLKNLETCPSSTPSIDWTWSNSLSKISFPACLKTAVSTLDLRCVVLVTCGFLESNGVDVRVIPSVLTGIVGEIDTARLELR